mgnify:CR=1 FL=1
MIEKSPVASGIPFDPTGSALTSVQVEAAIKEIAASVASGLQNYNVISTTAFTTSSTTDVLITGFTITPVSGTWAVFYNASSLQATNGANQDCTIFKAGTAITDSRRNQRGGAAGITMIMSTLTVSQFNGSQTCDVRVRTNTGSITINARTLVLIRLGP